MREHRLTRPPKEGRTSFEVKVGKKVLDWNSSAGGPTGSDAVFDEMVTGTGQVRPHWRSLMSRLSPLDPAMLEERRDEAAQLVRQHGVTYAVYGDPVGAERPWPLDLIPLIIPGTEWRTIETGVIQRIRLLNAILADIYGGQELVAAGQMPAAILHANPSFLRPCRGLAPPGGTYLHFAAIDLARGPDGRWRVLADRTQAPSGAGYALENRSVVGRVLADCVGVGIVQPLAPFFALFRDNLHALLPPSGAGPQPRIVLLTPGPYNETYFEHVFLARQLGITLVEGNDLTVRDRRVFLKTLSGLEHVGVILRRLDDDFCDPLELRSASALGVAGLVEAVRAGTVVVANALGSGFLEAPALKRLLPGLAPALLGEQLELSDVPTWWCASEPDRAHVLGHLERLVIKPAFPPIGTNSIFGERLSRAERSALAAKIGARPMDFVGQERLPLSTAPIWNGQKLEPRPLVLRVFVAAIGDGFCVMPGGLTRTSASDGPVISMQLGSGSKDTWVTGPIPEGEPGQSIANPRKVASLPQSNFRRPAADELPSRVADSLFWVGRYAERTDCAVRLLRTLLVGITDAVQPWRSKDSEPILNLAAWLELVPLIDQTRSVQPINLVQDALLDPSHPGGVVAGLQRLLGAARSVRDRLPPDCWRIFMALDRHTAAPVGRAPPVRLLLRLEELMTLGAGLSGAITETMIRDAGWRFVEIGRRLERAMYLVTMMRGLTAPPRAEGGSFQPIEERRLLAAMLALADSRAAPGAGGSDQGEDALDRTALIRAVLANERDPRSLTFQLTSLAEHLSALPRPKEASASNHGLVDLAVSLAASARGMVLDAMLEASRPRRSRLRTTDDIDPLRAAFGRLDLVLPQISDLLTQAYFTHALVRSA